MAQVYDNRQQQSAIDNNKTNTHANKMVNIQESPGSSWIVIKNHSVPTKPYLL